IRFEPDAARITLPGTFPKPRPFTGLIRAVNVKGDFDIQVDFEIFAESEAVPPGSFGTRLGLLLQLDGRKTVALSRTLAEGTKRFAVFYQWPDAAGTLQSKSHVVLTQARRGRLRLVRAGTRLSYLAAEGPEQGYRPLREYEIGAD